MLVVVDTMLHNGGNKRMIEYLDSQMKNLDDSISMFENQISLLQERKQIIINEVVTGKVKVVNNQIE